MPQVTVMTPILDYSRCFLRHPYEHQVHFQNDTDLPAKYELLPQEIDEFTPILYTSPQPKVFLLHYYFILTLNILNKNNIIHKRY